MLIMDGSRMLICGNNTRIVNAAHKTIYHGTNDLINLDIDTLPTFETANRQVPKGGEMTPIIRLNTITIPK